MEDSKCIKINSVNIPYTIHVLVSTNESKEKCKNVKNCGVILSMIIVVRAV